MLRRHSATCVTMLIVAAPSMAAAQSICVDCTDPDRNYRCSIKNAERVQNVRGASRGLEFLCISEIARLNGHKTCRVNTTFSGPCIGQHHEVDLTRSGTDAAEAAKPGDPAEAAKDGATATPASAPAPKGPPQTVEQLAKETMAKSKEQFSAVDEKMRQAGGAIGDAMKKSWNCVVSLFSKC